MSTSYAVPVPVSADVTLSELHAFRNSLSPKLREKGGGWLLVLLAALVSCHHGPEMVVDLYQLALSESEGGKEASQRIQRQIQEVLVKGSVIFGIPASLETMFALLAHIRAHIPTYLLTKQHFSRAPLLSRPLSSLTTPANEALRRVYRHNLDQIVDEKMGENMEDLKFLTLEINYGFTLANQEVIDWKDTGLVILPALVAQNCRAEVLWHLRGALRAGWERQDVESVSKVAIEIATRLGKRTDKVPGLDEVKEDSND